MTAEWITITIANSGLSQRVRKTSITAYGTMEGCAYILRGGQSIYILETETALHDALEDDE